MFKGVMSTQCLAHSGRSINGLWGGRWKEGRSKFPSSFQNCPSFTGLGKAHKASKATARTALWNPYNDSARLGIQEPRANTTILGTGRLQRRGGRTAALQQLQK